MEIGRLTEADLPALAGLYRQFWGENSCPEKMRATFRRLKDRPDYTFLAAKDNGRLVGSVLGIVCGERLLTCDQGLEDHSRLRGRSLNSEREPLPQPARTRFPLISPSDTIPRSQATCRTRYAAQYNDVLSVIATRRHDKTRHVRLEGSSR